MNSIKFIFVVLFIYGIVLDIEASDYTNLGLDSLESILLFETDSVKRIEILNHISKEYFSSSTVKALEYADSALILAKRIENRKLIAEAYKNLGGGFYYHGELDKAIKYTDSALTIFRILSDTLGIGKTLNNLGVIYNRTCDYKNALLSYLESFNYKEKTKNYAGLAQTHLNIGGLYYRFLKLDDALSHFEKALSLNKQIGNKKGIINSYNNIGIVYLEYGKYNIAEKKIRKSLSLARQMRYNAGISSSLDKLGKIFLETGKLDSAMIVCQESQHIKDKMSMVEAVTIYNIGKIHYLKEDYHQALYYFQKALDIAIVTKSKNDIVDAYNGLQLTYSALKQYETALFYLRSYLEEYEKLNEEIRSYEIERIRGKYEAEKREMEISDLIKENRWNKIELQNKQQKVKIQQILLFSIVFGMIIILSFSLWVLVLFRKNKKSLELLETKHEKIYKSKMKLQDININLSENEKRLAAVVDNIPVFINAIGNDGHFKLWNKYCEKSTGYRKEEIINNPNAMSILYPDKDYKTFIHSIAENKKYEYEDYITEITCKNGSKKLISWTNISNEIPIREWREWACGIDVTELENAASENDGKEKLNKEFLEFIPDLVFILDNDGNYINVNSYDKDLLKIIPEEVIGKNISETGFNTQILQKFQKAIEIVRETHKIQTFEFYFESSAGLKYFEVRIVKINDNEILAILRDITLKNIREEQKNEKLNSLNKILDSTPESIVLCDLDGKIIYSNSESCKLFGFEDSGKFAKENFFNLILTNQKYKEFSDLLKQKDKSSSKTKEFTLIRKDNRKFYAELSIGVSKNDDFEPDGYVIIIKDNTDKAALMNEFEKKMIKAQDAEKIKAKFLSDISFEIRSSMNSIIGFSDLLSNKSTTEVERKSFTDNILKTSKLLSRIVNDIIDISKFEKGTFNIVPSRVNVYQFVQEIYDNIKQSSFTEENPRIEFKLNMDYNLKNLTILTDDLRLRQVLNNIIENAFRFTDVGFVEISCKLIANKMIQFSINDSGFGISKERHANIFDKTNNANISDNRNFTGTGLGLIIAKSIIERLGGKIWFESEPNKGSSFKISLPISKTKSVIHHKRDDFKKREKHYQYDWHNYKILIAEDIDSNFFYFEAILKRTRIEIFRAKNGREAIEIVKNNPEIELILMDIQMPDINGYKATSIIKNLRDDIIIIAQTAYGMANEKRKILNSGFDNFIAKPINANELLEMLCQYYN